VALEWAVPADALVWHNKSMLAENFRDRIVLLGMPGVIPRYSMSVRRDDNGKIVVWHQFTERDRRLRNISLVVFCALFLGMCLVALYGAILQTTGGQRALLATACVGAVAALVAWIIIGGMWGYYPSQAAGEWLVRFDLAARSIEYPDGSSVLYDELRQIRSRTVVEGEGEGRTQYVQHQVGVRVGEEWRWYGVCDTHMPMNQFADALASVLDVTRVRDRVDLHPRHVRHYMDHNWDLRRRSVKLADRWIRADSEPQLHTRGKAPIIGRLRATP
jgi:hypothetical protein